MTRLKIIFILMAGVLLIVGCAKPATQSKTESSTPKDPEEAALKVVAFVYENYARNKQKPPQGWNDLEGFTAKMDSTARSKALDAIKKIQSLNYEMTWGFDFRRIYDEGLKPTEVVIAESPDGRLKITYSAKIIKKDKEKEDKEKLDQKEPTPESESNDTNASS